MIDVASLTTAYQREAAELCARAYLNDPSTLAFLGDKTPEIRFKLLARYWSVLIAGVLKSGSTLAAFQEGRLVAVKLFYKPNQYPVPFLLYLRGLWGVARVLIPCIGVKGFLKYFEMIHRLKKAQPQEPHFYMELICVDPHFQKQGVYATLQKEMARLADQAKVGIYCETSNKNNIPLFERFGFQVMGESLMEGITYWSLWREPRKGREKE